MKEQVFKFDHHTVTYHGGGRYTLKADEGYQLTDGKQQVSEVETKDYTQWHTIEAPDEPDAPEAEAPELTETADGESEKTETEAPTEEEAPAEDKTETEEPAEEESPAKPAKTKKAKAKAE